MRRTVVAGALVASVSVMFVCQLILFPDPARGSVDGAFLLMAGLALPAGLIAYRHFQLQDQPPPGHGASQSRRVPRLRLSWLALSVGCSLYVTWRTAFSFAGVHAAEYLLVWGIGIGVFLLAAAAPAEHDDHPLRAAEYGLIAVLFALALFIRIYQIEELPYILDQDEARFALNGVGVRQLNFADSPFKPGVHSHPQLNYILIGLSTSFLGETLVGARLPSVIFGAFGIPAIYLLGRELIGWRGGLIAALFALTWPFHIIFSRLALNQAGDSLFATLPFYFLLRGQRRGAPLDYALSGITLAAAQLFYAGGRLAVPIMGAYLLWLFLRQRRALQPRLIGILLLAFGVTTLPQHFYLIVNRLPLTDRDNPNIFIGGDFQRKVVERGGNPVTYLALAAENSFLGLFTRGDTGGWYGRGSNLLGPFGGPPFLLGVVVAGILMWRRGCARLALPSGWTLTVIVLLSMLATFPPQYQRYFPASAPMAILVGIGIVAVIDALVALLRAPGWRDTALLGAGLLFCAANLGFFVDYYVPGKHYVANRANFATNLVARAMAAQADAGRQVVLITLFRSGVENTGVVKYYMAGRSYLPWEDETPLKRPIPFLEQIDVTRPFAIFIPPNRRGDLEVLKQAIPGGTEEAVYLNEDRSLAYYLYRSYMGLPPPPPQTIPGVNADLTRESLTPCPLSMPDTERGNQYRERRPP